ncbi:multicopper oxidase family protein [candidate division WWE3 bacterium]|jgi:FtsP/CotA-like multicopper oxidase with cupredoxin domain|uniref:Multicopper oxidase family protein n=1 Tax=candidate division WWE3 bacterium TaxID=2053526 RepID=A0A3A4ZAP6_UNCKA|nr:MAG: multicopper oxidase family protein [candidate division WWE3 bacterium]
MKKAYLYILIPILLIIIIIIATTLKQGEQTTITKKLSQVEVKDLEAAKPSSIVELKNGDSLDLTATIVKKNINGVEVKMLAYNGQIPGPLIKTEKGSEVTINFTNNTDMESTIHSHGVRLDNKFDGVPDITQEPVKVGDAYVYKIKFPDEGMYWYHPHIREDYQQELGLYGNYLVSSDDQDYWNPVNQEIPLFLDDIQMESGQIAAFNNEKVDHAFMGRFGNVMLVNGETNYSVNAKQGDVIRFYLTNSANTRTFHFAIPGIKLKLVGGDNGRFEKEELVDAVIVSPSERYIIEASFDKSGNFEIQNKTPEKAYKLGVISVSNETTAQSYSSEFSDLRVNNELQNEIAQLTSNLSSISQKSLTISIDPMGMGSGMLNNNNSNMMGGGHMMGNGMMMQNNDQQKIEWEDDMGMMNKNATADSIKWKLIDQANGKENMDINWTFKKGELVRIKLFNDPNSPHPMQHPVHIHGQRFLVLNTNGVENTNKVWKDTTLVQTGDTVEILVEMSNPGDWLIHCHIPEHMEAGMMSKFEVI